MIGDRCMQKGRMQVKLKKELEVVRAAALSGTFFSYVA